MNEIIRCPKGHFYDPSVNPTCPQCAKEAGLGGVADIGATVPADAYSGGVTIPVGGAGNTIPVTPFDPNGTIPTDDNYTPTKPTQPDGGNSYPKTEPAGQQGGVTPGVQDYEVTTPMSFGPTDTSFPGGQGPQTVPVFRPVVGWLVCVSGSNKGSDYRIYNGYNYIGRALSMDICIQGDTHISNENAAVIGYDDVERVFYVGSVTGHNTVRLNGKMVLGQTLLNAYDEVKLGETTLVFIPLCGERFDWNGKEEK